MKPNQEITAKFYIAMIVFFAIWLSFPVKNYLIESNIINYSNVSGFYFICLVITLVLYMILALRYSEVKSSLKNLKEKAKNEKFFRTVSIETIIDYDNQIKEQESKITELKTAFEDSVAEITELRSKNKLIESCNQDNLKQITYWKERALHQKHTKKVVESENAKIYECLNDGYGKYFTKGEIYVFSNGKNILGNDYILLITNEGIEGLAHKSDFKPVKP